MRKIFEIYRYIYRICFKHAYDKKLKQKIKQQNSFLEFQKRTYKELRNFDNYLRIEAKHNILSRILEIKRNFRKIRFLFPEDYSRDIKKTRKLEEFIINYNQAFIEKQINEYKDFFYKNHLNSEQIKAVLINERNTLVIAGPGSGKTRTLIERIAFYVKNKNVAPNQILVLAYNTSAVGEIKERLDRTYGIKGVEIRTFHSLALKIVSLYKKYNGENFQIEGNSRKRILEIIEKRIKEDPHYLVDFATYFDTIERSNLKEYHELTEGKLTSSMRQEYFCIDGTKVKSIAERDIGNFFILNSIKFNYEVKVDWCDREFILNKNDKLKEREYHPDFYLPDYDIYLEHWAIAEDEQTPEWFNDNPDKYNKIREWKREQFKKHKKILLETDYHIWRNGTLEQELIRLCDTYGIKREPISHARLLHLIGKLPEDKGILFDMITNFIHVLKTHSIPVEKVQDRFFKRERIKPREKLFFQLVLPVYKQYEEQLKKNNLLDFSDMINLASKILEKKRDLDNIISAELQYKMIYLDEFQDISPQRFRLLQNLIKICEDSYGNHNLSIFYVGDDWQAIYGFTGATNKYLVNYRNYFFPVKQLFLLNNYRNPAQIIEYGKGIIEQTSSYIPKDLRPMCYRKDEQSPIFIRRIKARKKDEFIYKQNNEVIRLLYKLISIKPYSFSYENNDESLTLSGGPFKPNEIMVLSRFNFGYSEIKKQLISNSKIPVEIIKDGKIVKQGIRFYSMHKSKGLEADIVIILNVIQGPLGIPSEIEENANYSWAFEENYNKRDEEARLYFVALTRARKALFIFTWDEHESPFIPSPAYIKCFSGPSKDVAYIIGKIKKETNKALMIMVNISSLFNEYKTLWVPKSIITHIIPLEESGEAKIILKKWWVKKRGIEIVSREKIKNEG